MNRLFFTILCFYSFSFLAQNTTVAENETQEKNYKSSIFLNGHFATNTKAIGVKYIGDVMLKKYPKYGIGFNLASEKIWGTKNLIIPANYQTDLLFGIAGFHFRYKLNEQLYVQPEFSVLIGKEYISQLIASPASYNQYGVATSYNYSERHANKIIAGGHLEQHLLYCPKKSKNLVLGISVFERFSSAKYYENDIGACAYIGIYF